MVASSGSEVHRVNEGVWGVESKTIQERMGLLRYTPLSVGGVVHPSPSSRPLPLPPSKFFNCKFRGWHMASIPIKSSHCALDKSVVGLTNNSSQVLTPILTGIEDEWEVTKLAADIDPESITKWELYLCSRPILDIRGKNIWELVVRDSKRALEFTRFYPNNVINSMTLKDAIMSIVQTLGVPKPQTTRFLRSPMKTIISKACNELGIRPVLSKRCLSLIRWLEEHYEPVYMRHPGFQKGAKSLSILEQSSPLELPDNLCGEKWAFVQLPLAGFLYSNFYAKSTFFFKLSSFGKMYIDQFQLLRMNISSSRCKGTVMGCHLF